MSILNRWKVRRQTVLATLAVPNSPAGIVWTFASTFVVIATVLVTLLVVQHRQVDKQWAVRQSSIADDRVRLVSEWLRERTLDAEANSDAPEVIAFLSQISRMERKVGDKNLLSHLGLLNHTKASYGYEGVYVLDAGGHVVAQAQGSRRTPAELEEAGRGSIGGRQLRVEWTVDGPGRGSLVVISPVLARTGGGASSAGTLGAVALAINPFERLFPLLTAEAVPTRSGETLLVSQSGDGILYLSPLRMVPGGFHSFPDDATHGAHLALQGRGTFGRFVDYRGATVLAAVRSVPGTELGLVAQIGYDEAFAGYRQAAAIETGLAALLIIALAGWFFGYRRYLFGELANLREAEFRALLEATPDALVILDASARIVLVNEQTEKLFGRRREELLNCTVTAILPGQDWLAQPGKDGQGMAAAGFAREAMALHKNGTLLPCELSLRVVEGNGCGKLYVAIRDLTARKRIEDSLRKSELQYGALFNGINDAAFVFYLTDNLEPGKFIQANDYACKMLGYTREELLQRSVRDIHSPEEFAAHQSVRETLVAGKSCLFETEFLTRDGRSIPVEANARVISFRGRRAVLAVLRDITDRKRSLALLEASERRFRRFIERNACAFICTSISGVILECNEAAARMLGYTSREEFQAISYVDLYANAADGPMVLERLQRDGVLNGFEVCLKRKDGSSAWVLINLTLVKEGGEAVIEGTGIDITDRRSMEKELRAIESLVEGSSDFIGYASLTGEVRYLNRAGQRFLGMEEGTVLGTCILDHIASEDRGRIRDVVLPAVIRDGQWVGETLFRNLATGEHIPMWQSAFAIRESTTGRPIAMATVCRDLSEIKRKESELRAARQAAEAGNRAKSRFLASMSHEIRTPMNGILGMARLLSESELSPEQRRYVDVVLSSGANLLALINQILDLSKIEAGKVVLERLNFELRPLLQDATEPLALEARSKGLEFTLAVNPGVPRLLCGDGPRLRQVIVNLIGNAVKFTSGGSVKVAVSVENRKGRDVTLRFVVSDTGLGISEEQARNLFAPFVQGDGSTTRKYGGTGLGLCVSKQIVELMGGQIGFESEPDLGTSFWFTVALEEVPAEAHPVAPEGTRKPAVTEAAAAERGKARILAAEDNVVNREVLLSILSHLGYRADVVENGEEAVKALRTTAYNIVLMDCEMPVMDGYQATRLIRDTGSGVLNPRIPIVAVTASAMEGDRDKCISAGMDDYLPKPISPESLLRMLDKWLSRAPGQHSQPAAADVPQAPASQPVFDHRALLNRMMGNRSAAKKVAQTFLQSAPSQLSSLREHLAERDGPSARRDAHTLKGSAASVSALALREVAFRAEQAASACSWSTAESLLPEMEDQLERLKEAIAASGRDDV